jgi:hypothetical protein
MNAREYDSSLRTDFTVHPEDSQGRLVLVRDDGKNWGITGIECSNKINGSGPKSGPDILVSEAQAKAYIEHIAALWNGDSALRAKLAEYLKAQEIDTDPDTLYFMREELRAMVRA